MRRDLLGKKLIWPPIHSYENSRPRPEGSFPNPARQAASSSAEEPARPPGRANGCQANRRNQKEPTFSALIRPATYNLKNKIPIAKSPPDFFSKTIPTVCGFHLRCKEKCVYRPPADFFLRLLRTQANRCACPVSTRVRHSSWSG